MPVLRLLMCDKSCRFPVMSLLLVVVFSPLLWYDVSMRNVLGRLERCGVLDVKKC